MSKAKRVTKVTYKDVTLEQAQQASEQFAVSFTKLSAVETKMNQLIDKVKSRYQDEITLLQEALRQPSEVLETYAKEQKPYWGKKKSLELLHTVIGFRTGNPKVEKKKGFSWDAVRDLLKKYPKFDKFIRKVEDVNKEAILAETDEKMLEDLKDRAFVFIDQDEKFYIQKKQEELETV